MQNGDRISRPLTKRQWLGSSIAELKTDLDWVTQKILKFHSQYQESV